VPDCVSVTRLVVSLELAVQRLPGDDPTIEKLPRPVVKNTHVSVDVRFHSTQVAYHNLQQPDHVWAPRTYDAGVKGHTIIVVRVAVDPALLLSDEYSTITLRSNTQIPRPYELERVSVKFNVEKIAQENLHQARIARNVLKEVNVPLIIKRLTSQVHPLK